MTPNHAAYVTAVASEFSAVGTIVTAIIAAYAARAWRSGLKRQREDECISAVHDWSGATGRAISEWENGQQFWMSFDLAWLSRRECCKTYAVVRRYRAAAPELTEESSKILNSLGRMYKTEKFDLTAALQLRAEIAVLVGKIEDAIR
jgi:hypothetical protein